jgi:hypothetical protein
MMRATSIKIGREKDGERIIEFSRIIKRKGEPSRLLGGLISFTEMGDGTLRVDVYNLDDGVKVFTPFHNSELDNGDD